VNLIGVASGLESAYRPERDVPAPAALRAAGAVVVGKTNLDQFATGLVGSRSPYGPVGDSRRPEFISGGSSSGSGVDPVRPVSFMPFAA
jgi:allophanate hydrolase